MRYIKLFLIVVVLILTSCATCPDNKRISFLQSFSPDVDHYRLYVSEVPDKVTTKSCSFLIAEDLNTGKYDPLTNKVSIDLSELVDPGSYYLGISSVGTNDEESKLIISDKVVVVK